ncbi:MAG: glycerophosphodiester phosphodiesterase [Lachnospiraceae bacterium]|nr:glycerophosphodiester phosphodiesterase [Lachnospiraceae bacterium]
MSSKKHPLIWGHRGASGYAPENTLPAFKLAADMGADGIELDIQQTKDGVIVVCHDETVNRTSDGVGWIKDLTFDELRKLDFSNGDQAYEGVRIPAIEEVFDLLEPTSLTINIELKTGIVFYDRIEEKILELTGNKNWRDRVIYSSFNHYSILKIKELDPDAKVGLLYADGPIDMPGYGKSHGVDALHPALYNLQYPNYMQDCRKYGLDVNVWTVDSKEYLQICKEYGVNAVITNYPAKAKELYEG